MKRCKVCDILFTPVRPLQSVCSPRCASKKVKADKAAEKQRDKERKEKLKTRSDWMKQAQMSWNAYVRARDAGKPCASCGAMPENKFGGSMDCSHYRSVGSAPHLRFHLHNAASACVKCNRYLGGNVVELRKGLIDRIGLEKIEAIEADNRTRKFDVEYLKRIHKIFSKKAKRKLSM